VAMELTPMALMRRLFLAGGLAGQPRHLLLRSARLPQFVAKTSGAGGAQGPERTAAPTLAGKRAKRTARRRQKRPSRGSVARVCLAANWGSRPISPTSRGLSS
jgi:hypothetical protein